MHYSEVKYQPERAQTYLGSPSIVRLPDGALLATHDYFGKECPKNHEAEESLTSVYRSEDNGQTWQNITHIMNAFWSNLFCHNGSVYLLGCSQQYGSIVIRKSDNGGYTWTHPQDETSGLLFQGGPYQEPPNYHCAPMPVVLHQGRLYRAFEDCTPHIWGSGFQSCVISADEDTDLLNAQNWTISNKVAFDPEWLPDTLKDAERPGWLEGNVVITPEGNLCNILRFNSRPAIDKATMLTIHDNGKKISFDPQTGFIDFPGGMTKFSIRRDPKTQLYLSLVNNNTDPEQPAQRNILSLYASKDLRNWHPVKQLLEDDSGLTHEDSIRLTGFQYVDWQFDSNDIIYLVRTAHRGAIRYHDSNRITYHVLKDYTKYLDAIK